VLHNRRAVNPNVATGIRWRAISTAGGACCVESEVNSEQVAERAAAQLGASPTDEQLRAC
jgi:hypothetical protein